MVTLIYVQIRIFFNSRTITVCILVSSLAAGFSTDAHFLSDNKIIFFLIFIAPVRGLVVILVVEFIIFVTFFFLLRHF